MKPNNGATMLSSTEVARRLGVSRRTVRRWVAAGLLRAYRVGGVLRVHPDDLGAFLARAQVVPERPLAEGAREVEDGRGAAGTGEEADSGCAG
ncbi:MAG: helix-turn-helix domain-containing protein [Thermoflexales bacterium]|nr:helix-turn-helix domain-containing protein [Thermoflexales bacterium]